MNIALAIPPDGACFEGHFPGRPILPGVALLDLALQALASRAGCAASVRRITFARLRQLVVPGDRLELEARAGEDGHVRIDVRRGLELVANAQLVLGTPDAPPPDLGPEEIGSEPAAVPDLDVLVPHRPPMRLISSIVRERPDGLVCTAQVPAGCGLAHDRVASVLAGVEAAAQAAAAWEALRRWRHGTGGAPRIGYLVAIRDLVLFAEQVAVEAAMLAGVRLEAAAAPLTHYQIETWMGAKLLLRGTIATYLA